MLAILLFLTAAAAGAVAVVGYSRMTVRPPRVTAAVAVMLAVMAANTVIVFGRPGMLGFAAAMFALALCAPKAVRS